MDGTGQDGSAGREKLRSKDWRSCGSCTAGARGVAAGAWGEQDWDGRE